MIAQPQRLVDSLSPLAAGLSHLIEIPAFHLVMAGLAPAIHVFHVAPKTWMPGTRPGMTMGNVGAKAHPYAIALIRRRGEVKPDRPSGQFRKVLRNSRLGPT